ncbi:MAG: UDP-glucose 4-epimerase [Planctomycetota bacterium]|jgi:UDP-glucose 4-epimerase
MQSSSPQKNPRRVLLTGAAGFIGSQLAREMCELGWQVFGVDDFSSGWKERLPMELPMFRFEAGDVSGRGRLAAWLRAEGPFDDLVHLAARVGVRSVLRDPEGCRASNLRGVREIITAIESLPMEQRPRVYAASSSEVYAHKVGVLHESDVTRSTTATGRWAYAASKLRGEEILDDAQELWSEERQPLHLRFFNVVGPGQDSESGMVLPTFVECALRGTPLPVHGDGSQVRTFAHVDEIARVLAKLIELDPVRGGALNIGGNARISIGELAQVVVRQAASASSIQEIDPLHSCGANFEGIHYREPDLRRLRELGLELPLACLAEIVSDTVKFHLERARPSESTTRGPACASPAS